MTNAIHVPRALQSFMSGQDESIPGPESPIEEKLIFLQSNMVSFVKQYQLPIIEVSLVVSKYLRILTDSLVEKANMYDEKIPDNLLESNPIDAESVEPIFLDFPLESLVNKVDQDRMDIFDTILRTSINRTELPFPQAIALLRDWEVIVRTQLSRATSPGHLFSPLDIPEGF